MLLTRFNIFLDWAVVAMNVLVAVAAAEAVAAMVFSKIKYERSSS